MTAVVGILCSDGVVIGTDSAVTMGDAIKERYTIEHSSKKLHVLQNKIIFAGTGYIGHGQRFEKVVDKAYVNKIFADRTDSVTVCRTIASMAVKDFQETEFRGNEYGALMAFANKNEPVLCEFGLPWFQPELKTEQLYWCSMGSTQGITDPFLEFISRILWPNNIQPTIQQAVPVVTWTLEHAIEVNPGGVKGPIRIAVLEKTGLKYKAREVDDLSEHKNWISGVEESIREQVPRPEGPEGPLVS